MSRPGALAHGTVAGDHVVVGDVAEANRLHNKALAGTPQPGNALHLSLIEAAHCVAAGWLDVAGARPTDLLAKARDPRQALTDYLAYRDLRERGLVARHAPGTSHFDVWPRGTASGPVLFQNVCCHVADPARTTDLLDGARGGIVCSVVDDDAVVTHYRVSGEEPAGAVPLTQLPAADGARIADRVLVTDPAANAAYAHEHLGTPAAGGTFLSALEAEAMQRRGALRLPPALPSSSRVPPEQVRTFEALRARGVVPKSGFRFGAHVRGYAGAPDETHADWLVHCARPGEGLAWDALSRGVRLAHGVRKRFVVAIPDGDDVRFVRVEWLRV